MEETCRVYYLEGIIKDYDWGKKEDGQVAQLFSLQNGIIMENKSYAGICTYIYISAYLCICINNTNLLIISICILII